MSLSWPSTEGGARLSTPPPTTRRHLSRFLEQDCSTDNIAAIPYMQVPAAADETDPKQPSTLHVEAKGASRWLQIHLKQHNSRSHSGTPKAHVKKQVLL